MTPDPWHLEGDRLVSERTQLRVVAAESSELEDGGGLLPLKKPGRLLHDYRRVLDGHPGFTADAVLELGMWWTAGLVYWSERLRPSRITGVDLATRTDPEPLQAYREQTDTVVRTHWGVSQDDRAALERIVADDDLAPLDLVLDDASHLPGPTEAGFDVLFPIVRPGGLYVIEDWCWSYVEPTRSVSEAWATNPPLGPIVLRLASAMADRPDVIAHIEVLPTLLVVERGPAALDRTFRLADLVPTRVDHRVRRVQLAARRAWRRTRRDTRRGIARLRSS